MKLTIALWLSFSILDSIVEGSKSVRFSRKERRKHERG